MRLMYVWYSVIWSVLIGIDQFTKWWARHELADESIHGRLLDFGLSWNPGISWGLLSTAGSTLAYYALLLLVGIVIVCFSVYTWQQHCAGRAIYAHLCVLAGAVSNLIDRIVFGAVVDFLHLHIDTIYWPTIFNLADLWILGGVTWLLIVNLREISNND